MNRPRPAFSIPACLLFSITLLFCASALAQELPIVEGKVVTPQGEPVPTRVNLRLETVDGMLVAEQPADTRGAFRFPDLQRGYYRVTATAEGFQTTQQALDLRRGAARFLITITMTPLEKSRPQAEGPVPASDLMASKNARKAFEKGHRALARDKLDEARAHFERAVSEYPCYARAQTELGVTFGLLNEFPSAETALKKALECDEGFLEAYIQLGLFLNLQKKFQASDSVLQKGLNHFPAAWQLHYQGATAAYGQGRYAEAEQKYLRAQSLSSAVPKEIHVRLADIYVQQNHYNKAYAELQAYLRAEPEGRFAAKAADVISRMEKAGVAHASQSSPVPAESDTQRGPGRN